jgi:uncharacterized protein with HEPN domain
MTIADVTARLSDAVKQRHPEIPWEQVRGFRNVAVHAYDQLQLRQVDRIVEKDLPPLAKAVESELQLLKTRRDRSAHGDRDAERER